MSMIFFLTSAASSREFRVSRAGSQLKIVLQSSGKCDPEKKMSESQTKAGKWEPGKFLKI